MLSINNVRKSVKYVFTLTEVTTCIIRVANFSMKTKSFFFNINGYSFYNSQVKY